MPYQESDTATAEIGTYVNASTKRSRETKKVTFPCCLFILLQQMGDAIFGTKTANRRNQITISLRCSILGHAFDPVSFVLRGAHWVRLGNKQQYSNE